MVLCIAFGHWEFASDNNCSKLTVKKAFTRDFLYSQAIIKPVKPHFIKSLFSPRNGALSWSCWKAGRLTSIQFTLWREIQKACFLRRLEEKSRSGIRTHAVRRRPSWWRWTFKSSSPYEHLNIEFWLQIIFMRVIQSIDVTACTGEYFMAVNDLLKQ